MACGKRHESRVSTAEGIDEVSQSVLKLLPGSISASTHEGAAHQHACVAGSFLEDECRSSLGLRLAGFAPPPPPRLRLGL